MGDLKGLAAQLDRDVAHISLTGRYWACVWDLDCVLELHLNELGCIDGWFEADGQRLEVSSGRAGIAARDPHHSRTLESRARDFRAADVAKLEQHR